MTTYPLHAGGFELRPFQRSDAAIHFYVNTLGFDLVEDKPLGDSEKRWVVVSPPQATQARLLLARAANTDQAERIGNQTGGRVFLFLQTDDFWRNYHTYQDRGVVFVGAPREEPYATVAVFRDLYGNQWDLLQPKQASPLT